LFSFHSLRLSTYSLTANRCIKRLERSMQAGKTLLAGD
jgi:hypothetical protein